MLGKFTVCVLIRMRLTSSIIAALVLSICVSCGKVDVKMANSILQSEPANVPTAAGINDGNFNGTGRVTKIDLKLGSVELDHNEIVGLMPAMRMEFYVKDKTLLSDLKVGDNVDFVVEYKQGTEIITNIKKHQ